MFLPGLDPVRCILSRFVMNETALALWLSIVCWAASLLLIYIACVHFIF